MNESVQKTEQKKSEGPCVREVLKPSMCCRYNFTYLATLELNFTKTTSRYFPGDNNGQPDVISNYAK